MRNGFYQFLLNDYGYQPSTAKERVEFCARDEEHLLSEGRFSGLTLDDIVQDDCLMGDALSLIPGYYRTKQTAHQNALRLYYRFVNGNWYDAWQYNQTRTRRKTKNVKAKPATIHCSIPAFIPNYGSPSHEDENCFPVYYADNVDESEKLPGLINFICEEYSPILDWYHSMDRQRGERENNYRPMPPQFSKIPVILSKECPTQLYDAGDEWLAQKIADLAKQRKGAVTDADILEILKHRKLEDRIFGMYHHSGCPAFVLNDLDERQWIFRFEDGSVPYIELYYWNTECPDSEEYTALISNCLAHEYCHFLHDCYAGKQFMTNTAARKAVIEGIADFCSVAYTLSNNYGSYWSSRTLIALAERKYNKWKEWLGSDWPYANALYFYWFGGRFQPFSDSIDSESFEKLFRVLEVSAQSMPAAYRELLS